MMICVFGHGIRLFVFLEQGHDLGDLRRLLRFIFTGGTFEAGLHVRFQYGQFDGLERAAGGAKLGQDIDAVTPIRDHALDGFYLSGGAVERGQLGGMGGVMRHIDILIPGWGMWRIYP